MNVEFTTSIDFNAEAAKRRLHLEPGGAVQAAIDMAVMKYARPFIPFDSGFLSKSAERATVPGSGVVTWDAKYAHFQYVGLVRTTEDGRVFARKHESKPILTDRPLQYTHDKNAAASAEWIEPMKAAYMTQILDEAQAAMKGGGK